MGVYHRKVGNKNNLVYELTLFFIILPFSEKVVNCVDHLFVPSCFETSQTKVTVDGIILFSRLCCSLSLSAINRIVNRIENLY